MNKIAVSLIIGCATAGAIYTIYRLRKRGIQLPQLDFAEYALGGS